MPWKFFSPEGAELVTLKKPEMRTTLPATANDGDEIILTDSVSAGTYHWHLRYVAARSSNKWVFVGGSALAVYAAAGQTASSNSYGERGTLVTIPVAGSYDVAFGSTLDTNQKWTAAYAAVGANTADANIEITSGWNAGGDGLDAHSLAGRKVLTLTAAALKLLLKSSNGADTVNASNTWCHVVPVALGG